ncbi:MAG: hypothetical protein E7329_02950 [Clostridiales bacterium]|nr:hypothetical protein [Clostridiales bacterium]
MPENIERFEAAENSMPREMLQNAIESFMEMSREMEAAGNHDMAQYYEKKARELTAEEAASSDIRLGGWYAGYTAGEWRDMAKEEYVKNGNSMKYRQYCDNAMKASS